MRNNKNRPHSPANSFWSTVTDSARQFKWEGEKMTVAELAKKKGVSLARAWQMANRVTGRCMHCGMRQSKERRGKPLCSTCQQKACEYVARRKERRRQDKAKLV